MKKFFYFPIKMSLSLSEVDPNKIIEELLKEREKITNSIKQIEKLISEYEKKYLENTINNGNIFRGWDNIFVTKTKTFHVGNLNKRTRISQNERLFSQIYGNEKNESEINNNIEKVLTQSSNNLSNKIIIETPSNNNRINVNINGGNIINGNNISHKHKKGSRNSLGTKRKRANNNENTNNNGISDKKDEQKNI